jgi:tRNA G10  N-methylase Trm11
MINKQVEPIPPVEVVEGFGVPLLAYSRAIMSLNINHQQDQAQALADAITSTKRAVISYHEDSMKDLQMDIRIKNEQIRQLQDALEEQEEAAVARDSELRRELLEMKVEKERYERAWNESVGWRAKYEVMKEERVREVQRAARVWETSEKAKLGK